MLRNNDLQRFARGIYDCLNIFLFHRWRGFSYYVLLIQASKSENITWISTLFFLTFTTWGKYPTSLYFVTSEVVILTSLWLKIFLLCLTHVTILSSVQISYVIDSPSYVNLLLIMIWHPVIQDFVFKYPFLWTIKTWMQSLYLNRN